ncbi:MAG: hypothetical protein WCK77_16500 [Verrucomicrobiota bacterium]
MAATELGTVGVWGIGADQTGLLITDHAFDFSDSEKLVLNKSGEVIGMGLFQEKVECKVSGLVPKTSAFSGKIAAVLALGNAIPAHAQTMTGGATILRTVSRASNNEDWEKIDLSAIHYPFLTVGS